MNSVDPIGGYFGLELQKGDFPHQDSTLLNSGRNCFEYILRAQGATHVYIPKYTCDVMIEPLQKLDIKYSWYEIDESLEIKQDIDLKQGEFIVYTNYFGIKDEYSKKLGDKYKEQLILDCSQALYFPPLRASHTFYSPRKFFGLPDGGILVTNKTLGESLPVDTSYKRFSHLIKRIDVGAEAGYEDFKLNDASLTGQPIKQMSQLTRALLGSVDFAAAKQHRIDNFTFLHERLKHSNKLNFPLEHIDAPMVYPYLTDDIGLRERLTKQKIFVATYWPNVLEWCEEQDLEYKLAKKLLPLPIDQRYGQQDMARIEEVINAHNN